MESEGKRGRAPDGLLIMRLAKEYGQSPEEVENWEAYWFNRAAELMAAENIIDDRRAKAMKRKPRR